MWKLNIVGNCSKLDGQELTCMACNHAIATGHVQVDGGVANGRVILLVCRDCASEADDARAIKAALVEHAMDRHINLLTGQVGPAGPPRIWHKDHWDLMEDANHHQAPQP